MDRFLAVHFFLPFLACLAAFTATYLIGDIFDRFDDLVSYGGFGLLGLEYFVLKLPLMVSQLMPAACLAGVLVGFSLLNRNGEVLACQQLGISRLAMAAPVLIVALILSITQFVLAETIVPLATRQARYLYSVELKKRGQESVFAGEAIWMRLGDGFLSAASYDNRRLLLHGVTLYRLGSDRSLGGIVHARDVQWTAAGWQPSGVSRVDVHPNGAVTSGAGGDFRLPARPADFDLVRQDPDEFSLAELNRYIHGLRKKGLDPGGYVVDRDLKYAAPVACLIMVALGVALSLDPLPRNLSLGRGFGLAIAIGAGYWLALGLTSSLGKSGLIPAWLGAWSPNFIFASLALAIFLFGEEH